MKSKIFFIIYLIFGLSVHWTYARSLISVLEEGNIEEILVIINNPETDLKANIDETAQILLFGINNNHPEIVSVIMRRVPYAALVNIAKTEGLGLPSHLTGTNAEEILVIISNPETDLKANINETARILLFGINNNHPEIVSVIMRRAPYAALVDLYPTPKKIALEKGNTEILQPILIATRGIISPLNNPKKIAVQLRNKEIIRIILIATQKLEIKKGSANMTKCRKIF